MPFTLAHPAAILPIARCLRGRVVVSALVIGSVIPDLPNVLPSLVNRAETHSLLGLVCLDAPVGLVAYVLLHSVLARPLASLLPNELHSRLEPYLRDPTRFASRSLARAMVSLLLGAATHLAWDSFTHPGTPAVAAIAVLRTAWLHIGSEPIEGYRVVQLASSLMGVCVLAVEGLRWWKASAPAHVAPVRTDPVRAAALGGLAAIVVGFALRGSIEAFAYPESFAMALRPLQRGSIAAIEGLLIGTFAFSLAWYLGTLFERLRALRASGADSPGGAVATPHSRARPTARR
jgi:membrane-bound metal-dependent hydrolase YbcI (DUF457 family)